MLRMDQVYVIRHKVLREGLSIRAVARQMGVSRNTVRKYLNISEPERRQKKHRKKPVMKKVAPRIEEILEEWKPRTTEKQRITGSRVHRQLVEEKYRVGITTVREYLREKKRKNMEVYIPLIYRPGDCAQVDYFEVTVEEDGVKRKAWKFLMRLMYSGWDFVWLYDRCDQFSFLDAHVRAFAFFGFVPGRIIYDNLAAAVKKRVGLLVDLTDRFMALSSHYLFEPCFARPGEGHDKGGPMKGATMLVTLQWLGITPSFSRPSVSNDNPYSETLFKTLKYRPEYPSKPFEDLQAAESWVAEFVNWYNLEHRHSSIRFVTPASRHFGEGKLILEKRKEVYEEAKQKNPSRWASRKTRTWEPIQEVTLNLSKQKQEASPGLKKSA